MAQLKTSSITPMPCVSFEWKGSGGLKACPGTTEEDSRVNLELCNTILLDADIKILYGVYQVEGAGQVTLYKTKGRKHISNIMCSSRKPSAYQKQESNGNVPTKVQKVDLQTEVDRDQAIVVALHYLRAKKVSDVTLRKLKPLLKRYCVSCMKDSAKDDLLRSLGRVLFERKVVTRNESEVITHSNLKSVI
ncbi:uncharacterized protein [Montipora capricornis]|uniref:uncharacterized protein isoform X2 n=1 Tax=Montipora capricornis TaxID=246305 RepID=UPI0035F20C49